MKKALQLTCKSCGIQFIYGIKQQEQDDTRHRKPPFLCHRCWVQWRDAQQARIEAEENEKERKKKEAEWQENQRIFEEKLKHWKTVPFDSLHTDERKTLFIIGNGFDLMHGVRSSYYSFRDSMGKSNPVREALESYFDVPDLWANLEDSLAHFDLNRMCNGYVMDTQLDIAEAYEEDAGVAEYFMAVERAVEPLQVIAVELPKKFQAWIDTLEVGTDERPLSHMFGNGAGRVLCFNYTEFPETLYHIQSANICYIHGCRKRVKKKSRERLILGHLPGLSDGAYEVEEGHIWKRNPRNRAMLQAAQDQAIQLAAEYDKMLTKRCSNIIRDKKAFFESLTDIQSIVVVGHSLSKVDWDYFSEVKKSVNKAESVKWYIGCHGLGGLNNLEELCVAGIVPRDSVIVFRTDGIRVKLNTRPQDMKTGSTKPDAKNRCLAVSADHAIVASAKGNIFSMKNGSAELLRLELHGSPSKAVFISNEKRLLLSVRGLNPAVYLFAAGTDGWHLVNELCPPGERAEVLNRRLRFVYVDDCKLSFVYNNRLCQYDLETGTLQKNIAARGMRLRRFEGEDIFSKIRPYT